MGINWIIKYCAWKFFPVQCGDTYQLKEQWLQEDLAVIVQVWFVFWFVLCLVLMFSRFVLDAWFSGVLCGWSSDAEPFAHSLAKSFEGTVFASRFLGLRNEERRLISPEYIWYQRTIHIHSLLPPRLFESPCRVSTWKPELLVFPQSFG